MLMPVCCLSLVRPLLVSLSGSIGLSVPLVSRFIMFDNVGGWAILLCQLVVCRDNYRELAVSI